jgi:hypothetical protein
MPVVPFRSNMDLDGNREMGSYHHWEDQDEHTLSSCDKENCYRPCPFPDPDEWVHELYSIGHPDPAHGDAGANLHRYTNGNART